MPNGAANDSFRQAVVAGIKGIIPLIVPAIPFGTVVGITIAESDLPNFIGWLSSPLVFAGAAQLVAITLLAEDAPALSAFGAAMLLNLRHVMYSAALVPKFRGQPTWFRWFGPYFLIDQVFAIASLREETGREWRGYYLGATLTVWLFWQTIVAVGILAGPLLPESLDLSFTVPAMFIGLLVPSLKGSPMLTGVVVAVVTTAALSSIPNRGGMLIGSVIGVVAAVAVDRLGAEKAEIAL